METIKKGVSFVKEVVARISGNDAEAIAQYNYRKATSALKSQIASAEAKIVDLESNLEEAETRYKDAIYCATKITDNSEYIRSIKYAKENVNKAKEELENVRESLAEFQKLLKDLE